MRLVSNSIAGAHWNLLHEFEIVCCMTYMCSLCAQPMRGIKEVSVEHLCRLSTSLPFYMDETHSELATEQRDLEEEFRKPVWIIDLAPIDKDGKSSRTVRR